MRHFKTVFLALLLTGAIAAQEPAKTSPDPELDRIKALAQQGWDEAHQFTKTGKKNNDPAYPGRKWAATLWQYREQQPATPAAQHATGEALHFLVHAELLDELASKAETLKAADNAWRRIVSVLTEALEHKPDYGYALKKLAWLTQTATDQKITSHAWFALGQAYGKQGDTTQARAAYQRIIANAPSSEIARQAEGNLFELDSLNVGQSAPHFAFKSATDAPISLAAFKGKVVLLNFWASWCSLCIKEFPVLKDLYAQHKDAGLEIIGISFDEEEQPFLEGIKKHALTWPQIRDGKERALAKLFNVKEQPANYLLDREGRIAGKMITLDKLSALLADTLKPAATANDGEESRKKVAEVIRLMELKPGHVIADIGAGNGVFTKRFAETVGLNGKAIGLEIDASAVRKMTADARRLNLPNYEARLVPPDDPQLTPGSVDVIFLSDAYHHINDRVNYFARVKAALKPGGKLVIVDYVRKSGNDDHSVVKAEVFDELRRAGYRMTREFDLLLPRQYFFEFVPNVP